MNEVRMGGALDRLVNVPLQLKGELLVASNDDDPGKSSEEEALVCHTSVVHDSPFPIEEPRILRDHATPETQSTIERSIRRTSIEDDVLAAEESGSQTPFEHLSTVADERESGTGSGATIHANHCTVFSIP
jgi:hypothetical protein